MKKISILLPVYNDEQYIKRSVNSILNSTYSNFELIIINDGSTDSSPDIINKINDPRIKLYSKQNTGLQDSLNYGIKRCNCEIIMRMDGDDEMDNNKIEIQLADFLNNKAVLSGTGGYVINNNSEIKERINVPESNTNIINCLKNIKTSMIHPSIMFYKDAIIKAGLYDLKFDAADDYEMYYRMSKIGKLSNINSPLLLLRKHEQNMSVTQSVKQVQNTLIARKIYIKNPEINSINNDLYIETKDKIVNSLSYYLLNLSNNHINTSRYFFIRFFYKVIRKITLNSLNILN